MRRAPVKAPASETPEQPPSHGEVQVLIKPKIRNRQDLIERWWQQQPGRYVCLSLKSAAGVWRGDHFFERGELDLGAFISEHYHENIYFCPHLFERPRRIKENAVCPQGLWADLDSVNPAKLPDELEPTIAIGSSPGRYVGLWSTDEPITEHLNKRLTYFLKADKGGWDLTQVLRLPGTLNHKYSPPEPVIPLWTNGPSYRVADLEALLPVLPVECSNGAATVVIKELSEDWRSICRRLGCAAEVGGLATDVIPLGKRSSVIWKIGKRLRKLDATPSEVARVLAASRCWQDKHGQNRAALEGEVTRIFGSR